MCNCKCVIQLTPEAEKLTKIIKILFFIDIILTIAKVFFARFDSLFSIIISLGLILATFLMCHYLLASLAVFFILFDMFYSITFLAQRLQNFVLLGKFSDIYLSETRYLIGVWFELVFFIFLVILFYFIFEAYREYKAITLGYINQPIGNSSYGGNEQRGGYTSLSQNNKEDSIYNPNGNDIEKSNKGYTAFSGKGTVVGGN